MALLSPQDSFSNFHNPLKAMILKGYSFLRLVSLRFFYILFQQPFKKNGNVGTNFLAGFLKSNAWILLNSGI